MIILVFSDSHGDSESMRKVMKRFYPHAAMYLGDGIEDFFSLEKEFPLTEFIHVRGNEDAADASDEERLHVAEEVSVYMNHFKMVERAVELNAQIALYGNSHTPELFVKDGITFMNPGSISKEFGFQTFGMIEAFEGEYLCKVMFSDLLVL